MKGLRTFCRLLSSKPPVPADGGRRLPAYRGRKYLRDILKSELSNLQHVPDRVPEHELAFRCPRHADLLIIGGGIVGSSVAYWLRTWHREKDAYEVVVVEKDPKYGKSSTALSAGGIRQQFSLPENVQLSLFGAEFLRKADEYLGVPGCNFVDVGYQPNGYLTLGGPEEAEKLKEDFKMQTALD